jgi:signal transduction histidine kinase
LIRREQEDAFRSLRASLASDLDSIAESLGRLTGELRARNRSWQEIYSLVGDHVQKGNLTGSLAVLSSSGEFLFASEGFLVVESATASNPYREAEILEFKAPEQAALRFAKLADTKDSRLRLEALNAAGRSYFRIPKYAEAAALYGALLRDWPALMDSESVVFPLMAGLQLAVCLEKQGQNALASLVHVYRELLVRRSIVSLAAVELYAEKYELAIERHCPPENSTRLCRDYREIKDGKAARLARLSDLERAREVMVAALRPGTPPSGGTRRVFPIPGCACLAVATRSGSEPRDASGGAEFTVAAIVDDASLLRRLAASRSREASAVQIRVIGPDRKLLHASSRAEPAGIYLEQVLGDGLPQWTVTLFHDQRDAAGLFAAQRRFYLALTFALVLLLIAGTFLTIRAVNHEMKVLRMKSDLVSLVSHEFKSPITSIRTLMERLQAGYVRDPGKMQQYFDVVCGELQRLTRLVNNFLAFSTMEAGVKEYHWVDTDLQELLSDLLTPFEARITQQGFTLETEIASTLPVLKVDRDSLSQAVLNLLDNAVKYSSGAKRVRISVRTDATSVKVNVTDWGQGIRADEAGRIFEKSYRSADSARQGVPGVGLGLAIVKHVMKAHGGDVTVESKPGQGSTFTLHLPLPQATAAEAFAGSLEGNGARI